MDLNEVSIFIKVIQAGSFTLAARQLALPNSTVSSKVSSLERRLGVTLIQRTTRKLNITPEGESYFRRCIQGLGEILAAEDEIASIQSEPQGLLRITAPVELGSSVLPGLISDYIKKYPKVRVEVLLTDRTIDLLSENVDVAIRAGRLKDSTLVAKKIGSVFFAPFASPKYLKQRGTPVHPRELRQHQCLHFTPLGVGEWQLTSAKSNVSVAVSGRVLTDDMSMLRLQAVVGDGIALLPAYFCSAETQAGKLIRILPEWRTQLTPVHFVYPSQKFVTPKLSRFIALASDEIRRSFESKEPDSV